jgi:hypothetical protein
MFVASPWMGVGKKEIEENSQWTRAEVLFTEDSATSNNTKLFNF